MNLAAARRQLNGLLRNTTAVSVVVLAVLVALVVGVYHGGVATFAQGAVYGCLTALAALGMVLVYRSNRIINFAQLSMGAVSVTLFTELVQNHTFLAGWNGVCSCLPADLFQSGTAALATNYALAAFLCLIVGPICALALYLVVVRGLAGASRLVATVATIGAGLLLDWTAGQIQHAMTPAHAANQQLSADVTPPGNLILHVGGAIWNSGALMLIGVTAAALLGLLAFFRFTRLGIAIRAAAENEERARSLGIGPVLVQSVVWIFAGLLAALANELVAITSGNGGTGTVTTPVILAALAAAVIGRFDNLPLTVAAGVVLGVVQQAVVAAGAADGTTDLVVAGVIVGVLLLRPPERMGRSERAAGSWLTTREIRATPRVLASLPPVRRLRIGTGIAVAALAAGLPFLFSDPDLIQVGQILIFGIVGLSLLVLSGWAGQISLGQFAIAAVGAWMAAVAADHGLPAPLVILAGAVAGTLTALLIGLPALRIRGLYLAVTTLALAEVVQTVLFGGHFGGQYLPGTIPRFSVLGLDGNDNKTFYYLLVVCAGLAVLMVRGVRMSRTGRALIASRDNEQSVQAFGISLTRARLQAFAVSGFIAGGAGALYAFQLGQVGQGTFPPELSEDILLMTVLGGLGSLAGPFLGVIYLGFAHFLTGDGTAQSAAVGVAVIVLLTLAPGGVAQVLYVGRDAFLRRVADRHHLVVPSLISGSRLSASGRMRVPLAPKLGPGGGAVFVPRRYRLDAVPANVAALREGSA